MEQEIEADRGDNKLYLSRRLTDAGQKAYPDHLLKAVKSGTEVSFAEALGKPGYFRSHEPRGRGLAEVPVTAPVTLAEAEFNRFYVRAICLRAIEDEIDEVVIYRAKPVEDPRLESQAKIGRAVAPDRLLKNMRANIGNDADLGAPNSGLSVYLE
ncbi:MAG: hypothetical protein EOO71_39575 [Myxococcaceae bacterium]|nr:MAG: hypothetical protein EOO71_39575 [Myxococcaceae bacterium]